MKPPPAYESEPEYAALAAAVEAARGDDLPKLVLADWIEERGDSERANAIRHGVEYGRSIRAMMDGAQYSCQAEYAAPGPPPPIRPANGHKPGASRGLGTDCTGRGKRNRIKKRRAKKGYR